MRVAILAVLLVTPPAFGHKLVLAVTPLADPPRLRVQAGYDDGTPADGATATVQDSAGVEAGRAALDANGVGELPLPKGRWAVTVDDGAGHRVMVSGENDIPVRPDGPNRWVMVAAGLALIGGWAIWRRMGAGR